MITESPRLTRNGHLSCKSQSGRIGYKLTCQTTHPDLGGFFPIISPWVCLHGLRSVDALPEGQCPWAKNYQKRSPRIAKSRYQELNNVIAVNQKILIMIVEKCRC